MSGREGLAIGHRNSPGEFKKRITQGIGQIARSRLDRKIRRAGYLRILGSCTHSRTS